MGTRDELAAVDFPPQSPDFSPFMALLGRAGVAGVTGPCRPRCVQSLKQEGEHAGTRDILRSVCFHGIWLFTQIVELLK